MVIIYKNNQSVIALIKNSRSHDYIKYIEIVNYFCREKIVDKIITFEYTFTNKQIVNELIKTLTKDKFEMFRDVIELK